MVEHSQWLRSHIARSGCPVRGRALQAGAMETMLVFTTSPLISSSPVSIQIAILDLQNIMRPCSHNPTKSLHQLPPGRTGTTPTSWSIQHSHFLFVFLLQHLKRDHKHWTHTSPQHSLILLARSWINIVSLTQERVLCSRAFLINTHISFKTTFHVDAILKFCG